MADDRIDPAELELMLPADIPDAETPSGGRTRRIGFGAHGQPT